MPATEHDHRFRAFGTEVRVLVRRAHAARRAARPRALPAAAPHADPLRPRQRAERAQRPRRARRSRCRRRCCARSRPRCWAARASDGLVDPTVLDDLEHAGYAGSRDGHAPASLADALARRPARRPAAPRRPARWTAIELDPSRSTIRLPAGVRLDLGGSAKGLAVDLAAGLLARRHRVRRRRRRRHPHRRQRSRAAPVHIRHPLSDEIAHTLHRYHRRRGHQRPADPPLAHASTASPTT